MSERRNESSAATPSPEARLTALAPAGSRWRFKYGGDGRVLVSTGIYSDWRNPADWTPGVEIVPVVGLQAEAYPTDWGTVSEKELEAYDRID